VAGIRFKNPLLAGSANHVRGLEYTQRIIRSGVGGIVGKSVTDLAGMRQTRNARYAILDEYRRPCAGKIPRLYTFYSRTGSMESPEDWLRDLPAKLALAREHEVVLIGSIGAGRIESWVAIARMMADHGVPMIELNLGCPHHERSPEKMGGLLGQDPEACRQVVAAVRNAVQVPLIVKVTPQVNNVMAVVRAVEEAGAAAVTVTNRFMGFAVDIERGVPYTGSWAAVGGPWIAPLSLRWVAQCYRDSRLPILGSNGAADWSDVIEFFMAGASLMQLVGRFMLDGPELIPRLLAGITAFMQRKGYGSIREMVGVAARAAVPYTELHRIPEQRVRLASELCSDCGQCLHACYYGALVKQDGGVAVTDACVGCELCTVFCPTGALQVEPVGAR
jgi:dihydroorotate dehydrogenase (fumarate)/dihydropyrimidine dehydrogenase (NAD+) subunit PreA